MNSPAELRALIEAATPGPMIAVPGSADYKDCRANARLIAALVNKAPAILALWEAAQDMLRMHDEHHGAINSEEAGIRQRVRAALDALEKE